jgi:hypothetical protein
MWRLDTGPNTVRMMAPEFPCHRMCTSPKREKQRKAKKSKETQRKQRPVQTKIRGSGPNAGTRPPLFTMISLSQRNISSTRDFASKTLTFKIENLSRDDGMTIVRGMITIELSELIPSPIRFGTIEHFNESWRYHRRILPLPTSPGVGLHTDKISYHIATAGLYHVYHCTIVSNI